METWIHASSNRWSTPPIHIGQTIIKIVMRPLSYWHLHRVRPSWTPRWRTWWTVSSKMRRREIAAACSNYQISDLLDVSNYMRRKKKTENRKEKREKWMLLTLFSFLLHLFSYSEKGFFSCFYCVIRIPTCLCQRLEILCNQAVLLSASNQMNKVSLASVYCWKGVTSCSQIRVSHNLILRGEVRKHLHWYIKAG